MAEVRQNYDSSRSFLLLTYKLYHKLDTLSGTNKAYCLTVFLSLLKYAWKSSGYKCSIRYATLIKDTNLSKKHFTIVNFLLEFQKSICYKIHLII